MIRINKRIDKDFTILNITDINLDVDEWHNDDVVSHFKQTVSKLVELSNPDLITVSGDFGRSDQFECYEYTRKFLNEINKPWAFCMGNHDNQDGYERSKLLAKYLAEDKNCLFEIGDEKLGVGNYVIQIIENGTPIHALVFMDSHDREEILNENNDKTKVWAKLNNDQLEWYKNTVLEIGINTTLITHIPLYVFNTAFNKAFNNNCDCKNIKYNESFNKKYWNKGFKNSFGLCHENICSYPFDGGEFKYIKDSKYTKLILVGHDHANNFVIDYEGVKLVYATKTGKGCYCDKELNGGTVIKINKNSVFVEQLLI